MSDILQQYLEGKIDFEGQKLVEQISRNILIVATAVSFVAGFATQSLQVLFGVFAAFVVTLSLAVIPPWPAYRRHPVKWLSIKETKA
ncbi:microsomal signal peptidase subunit [Dichomitus squalens]|uniref:Signal peptidase complex subunit 1 n=1 Tax=Dichomitus squalens TaxID=114155 RepID=A0A4Q9NW75_9APHY|nr:microsomal signal peptidase subunit [Dichomitus squalens]TBU46040.1 microsomal signal peptidase subunit [Dichomitus squalens]TBU60336.1 microsomal signal peptidase subunit [Dichomitus squalens]